MYFWAITEKLELAALRGLPHWFEQMVLISQV